MAVLSVPFDSLTDFRLMIPADWKCGRYRLVKIETGSFDATSEQLRNFTLEGVTAEGVARTGTCPLPFSVLDLVVSAGPSRRGLNPGTALVECLAPTWVPRRTPQTIHASLSATIVACPMQVSTLR